MSTEQKLEVALARLEERVEALQDDMKDMKSDMSELRATANRWKGAFWVMMGFGGVVGIISNIATGWLK
jgi:urocanate hydratase|tara:strand:+ start:112 stop:318 length:207 start_codon:yes stop_codon:yes gene_type:complete